MNEQKQLEYLHKVKKLSDSDNILLMNRRRRRDAWLLCILYFSAILFIIRISLSSVIDIINYGIKIKPFNIFQTTILFFYYQLMKNLLIYAGFIFTLLLIFFIFEYLNKNRSKEKMLLEKLKSGRH